MRVYIWPEFGKENGQGGIKRVWEALYKHLPSYDVEIVNRIEDADVVNLHADWLKTDKPIALSHHGLYWAGYEWPKWALDANAKLIKAAKHSQALSVPSRFVHNVFARGMLLNPFVLYHGVDVEDWNPVENHGYVFWGKTRVDPICDPEPVNKLAALCSDVKFISTFGDRDLANITTTGRLTHDRSKALIQHAGVYLATVQETGAITVLEAMASGVPAVGFRHGVNAEIIEHGVTGWLVDPGDYDGLREGIYLCLADRKRIGENARQAVIERFQWKDRVGDYLPFYQAAIDGVNYDNNPKVSVVVTAYNLSEYLPACLDSVLQQDFSEWECIVVNDASPDNCGQIAEAYASKDRRFRVIHNPTNLYLAESRNTGIRSAKGQYILPLDADDEIAQGTLRVLSTALDQNSDLDIATGGFQLIEPDGRRWVSHWPADDPSFNLQIRHHNQVPYASMYRKWVWERTGGYRRRWKSAEDAEFWTRAMSYGAVPAKVTKNPTLVYNNRPNSMSHTVREPDWTAWFIWSRIPQLTPFGASGEYPNQPARPVLDYDPIKVSVIIPCGPNHEIFLQDAIDSITAQTFQKYEIIVVNDTGKRWFNDDNQIICPYIQGFPFVKFLDSEGKPAGPAAARNRGIAASLAPCFVLLDADDFAQPLFLELLYRTWKHFGGWVYTDWFDQHGELKEAQDFEYDNALVKMPGPSTGIYSKADWERVGGFDESIVFWEDWDYQLTLMGHGSCGRRIKYAGFTYRYDTGTRRELSHANEDKAIKTIRKKHETLYRGGCYE